MVVESSIEPTQTVGLFFHALTAWESSSKVPNTTVVRPARARVDRAGRFEAGTGVRPEMLRTEFMSESEDGTTRAPLGT